MMESDYLNSDMHEHICDAKWHEWAHRDGYTCNYNRYMPCPEHDGLPYSEGPVQNSNLSM